MLHHSNRDKQAKLVWILRNWWRKQAHLHTRATTSESQRTLLGCGRTGDWLHECEADKSAEIMWYNQRECFQQLVEYMSQRTEAVLRAKGGSAQY